MKGGTMLSGWRIITQWKHNLLICAMLIVSELFIYPIKSLGGISVKEATVTDRGFRYDRRWMLVDDSGQFYSQRSNSHMALLQVEIIESGLHVYHKQDSSNFIDIPFRTQPSETIDVVIWDDICKAELVSKEADQWFTKMLDLPCRLVYMPDDSLRKVDLSYAANEEITSFSDAYPMLLIGQSSLDDLNSKLSAPVPMNRFRPNIVFTGGVPFQEDEMESFTINGIWFAAVKPCDRCLITTIDQETAAKGKDPLKTLAAYRTQNNKVMFGQNLLFDGRGRISVGDELIWL
jgi:uncharacterized protein YcbX